MKLALENFSLMGDRATQKLFQIFDEWKVSARFVGGCVRDAVLGMAPQDIDIAVSLPPHQIMNMLAAAEVAAIPTGYDFGTITAVIENRSFQITSLRKEWETDGRRPRVTFGAAWEADAARRDFTINALYADKDGTVYDYFGGLEDLKAGVVRFVGNAPHRIQEDYLRILRYFRFLAWYGSGAVSGEAIDACKALRKGLTSLSRERIGREFLKLLAAPSPLHSCVLMHQAAVDAFIVPCPLNLKALEALLKFPEESSAMCRLAALSLPQIDARGMAKALRLARPQMRYLRQCASRLKDYPSPQRTIHRNLYQDGVALFKDLTLLSLALQPLDSSSSILREAFRIAASWKRPPFPLSGKDLAEMGIKAGPEMGKLLKNCEAWWIDQGFQPDGGACRRWVKDHW